MASKNATGFMLRPGDSGVGIPRPPIRGARLLPEETAERKRAEEDASRWQTEEKLDRIETTSTPELPPSVRRAATWAGCVLASVLGLVLVSQTASLATDIEALPTPFNWIAGTLAAAFGLALAWLIGRLSWRLIRLRRNPAVDLQAIRTLQEREQLRERAAKQARAAQRELRDYLEQYRIDGNARRRFIALGLAEEDFDKLVEAKRFLIEDQPMSSEAWIAEFRRRFGSILDHAAKRRTASYAKKVGVGTALAPAAVIDQAIVIYACLALIKDLTFLYGLRPTVGQSMTVLARSIVQTYLGGLLQEATEEAAGSMLDEVRDGVGASLPATIPGVGAKIAEGAANGFLISRLGQRAIALLQPVRPAN